MTPLGSRRAATGRGGFTLIEVLVAILILAIVITTALAVFVDRTRRLQRASESILAWQALSNEAEIRRRINFGELDDAQPAFMSDVALLAPLPAVKTNVAVATETASRKIVTMTVSWRGGSEKASLQLVRVDTGGSNLW